jgi:SAM-dependent methyltransferase
VGEKFDIQEAQYAFPYHYIPHFAKDSEPSTVRSLNWGLEYLCYQNHILNIVLREMPSSVLEVGCGDGFFIGLLVGKVPVLKGVDLSEKAIRFAKAFHEGVDFEAVDAAAMAEQYDIVVALEVLEHVPDEGVSHFVRTLADRARPGGKVVLSVPTTAQPLHKKHYRHYDLDSLKESISLSGAPLKISAVDYVFHETPIFTFWRKLTNNRLWVFELKPVRKLVWRYVWKRLRHSSPSRGRHLVCVLEKI